MDNSIVRFSAGANTLSIYIHVPFCVRRCTYCDFYSTVCAPDDKRVQDFFDSLLKHIRAAAQMPCYRDRLVTAIYFGGGTPSYVYERLSTSLAEICKSFSVAEDCEISFEANPDSFSSDAAMQLKLAGFNRVSVGVQSLNEGMLEALGRSHSTQQAFATLEIAHDLGFRTSADIMLGLPGDSLPTTDQWERLLPLIGHIAIYPLTVEEGTQLYEMVDEGNFKIPDDEQVATEVLALQRLVESHGFQRYEISSYARPSQESRQNLRYWIGGIDGDYLGLGPSAASMSNLPDGGRHRFVAWETLEDFVNHNTGHSINNPSEGELLTASEARREDIMLALRTSKGISGAAIAQSNLCALCDELLEKGLLETYPSSEFELAHSQEMAESVHYRCTQEGWLLANIVFSTVWLAS